MRTKRKNSLWSR